MARLRPSELRHDCSSFAHSEAPVYVSAARKANSKGVAGPIQRAQLFRSSLLKNCTQVPIRLLTVAAVLLPLTPAWANDQAQATASASVPPLATTPVAAPAPSPMPWPGMSAGLAANPNPTNFDAGTFGKITVDGVVSGLALTQSHPALDFFGNLNKHSYADLSNAQIIINKSSGVVQFYVQAGAYSLPALGTPYLKAVNSGNSGTFGATEKFFGPVPQGFLKIVPNANFSIEAGALPTLQGAEYTFTFENYNIERGLLWNQENAVNRGVQANFTAGHLTGSVAFSDGYFSRKYNSISGLLTYTFKNTDTLAVVGQGELSTVDKNTLATPVAQANSRLFNVIYSHTLGKWTISPYFQYTSVPSNRATRAAAPFGGSGSGSTIGAALFIKYAATPQFSVSTRGEYISSRGSPNLLYGPRSRAYSLTVTPTYQKGIFFIRGEASYVAARAATPGLIFGPDGLNRNQGRFMAEAGILF